MTGAAQVWDTLRAAGVTVVFGIPGGAILPLVDALFATDIDLVVTRNESAAAHAADGYARASGRVGVCLATSGPGGTNVLTGLGTAQSDSVPLLVLVGQVPLSLIGTDAFQGTDVFGLSLGLTKHSYRITHPNQIPGVLGEAMAVALSGRPGPVLVEIPKDVQQAAVTEVWPLASSPRHLPRPSALDWARARRLLRESVRPVIYCGGGVVASDTRESLVGLSERFAAPVVSTLMGLGAMPASHPHFLGMLGMHGTWTANHAVSAADLLIAVGARFDDRVTGRVADFAAQARVLHLDVDPAEIGKIVQVDAALPGDLRHVLPRLAILAPSRRHTSWWNTIRGWQQSHPLRAPADGSGDGIPSPAVMQALAQVLRADDVVATEVGQHQMWAALYLPRSEPRTFITSGGSGTMGYGFPAAIGAARARPDSRVVSIMGDGSFQMNLQELATVAQYQVPLLMVVMNNGGHGMVRQWQDLFYQGRRHGIALANPDFVKLAASFGLAARQAETRAELDVILADWDRDGGALLVEVKVPVTEPVFPMVASGEPLTAVRER
jgi:acetolactate synthase-1/2/3 large subunit